MAIATITRLILILLLLLLLAGLHSCNPQPLLRIGNAPWPGYLGMHYARDLGLYRKHPVQLVDFDNSEDTLRAFHNHAINAVAITLDEALSLAEAGNRLRIVLVFNESTGADVVLARPGINSPAELKGHRLGLEANALGSYILVRLLETSGLQTDDLNLVHIPLPDQEQAYRVGRVDAVITHDPVRTRLLARGVQEIFSTRDIPNEIVDVLVVHEEDVETLHKSLLAFKSAYLNAMEQLQRNKGKAAPSLSKRLGFSPEGLLDAWQLMEFPDESMQEQLLTEAPPGLRGRLEKLQQIMQQQHLLKGNPAERIRLGIDS